MKANCYHHNVNAVYINICNTCVLRIFILAYFVLMWIECTLMRAQSTSTGSWGRHSISWHCSSVCWDYCNMVCTDVHLSVCTELVVLYSCNFSSFMIPDVHFLLGTEIAKEQGSRTRQVMQAWISLLSTSRISSGIILSCSLMSLCNFSYNIYLTPRH